MTDQPKAIAPRSLFSILSFLSPILRSTSSLLAVCVPEEKLVHNDRPGKTRMFLFLSFCPHFTPLLVSSFVSWLFFHLPSLHTPPYSSFLVPKPNKWYALKAELFLCAAPPPYTCPPTFSTIRLKLFYWSRCSSSVKPLMTTVTANMSTILSLPLPLPHFLLSKPHYCSFSMTYSLLKLLFVPRLLSFSSFCFRLHV